MGLVGCAPPTTSGLADTSPPVQYCLPVPVMTTARMLLSVCAAVKKLLRASAASWSTRLPRDGRYSVTSATAPSCLMMTPSFCPAMATSGNILSPDYSENRLGPSQACSPVLGLEWSCLGRGGEEAVMDSAVAPKYQRFAMYGQIWRGKIPF